jgi:hypothetical protein
LDLETSAEQAVSIIRTNGVLKYSVKFPFSYPNAQIIGVYHNGNRVCEESLGEKTKIIQYYIQNLFSNYF